MEDIEFLVFIEMVLVIGTIPILVTSLKYFRYGLLKSLILTVGIQICSMALFYLVHGALWNIEGPEQFRKFFFQEAVVCVPVNSLVACAFFKVWNKKAVSTILLLNSLYFILGWPYLESFPSRPKPRRPFPRLQLLPPPPYVDRTDLLRRAI